MGAHLIDRESDYKPPEYRAGQYAQVARHIMIVSELWKQKIKPCEKTYDEKQDQRIGKREQEAGDHIFPPCVDLKRRSLERSGGILAKQIRAESSQNHTSEQLKQRLVALDETGDERHAETREQTIDQIAHAGSGTCEKSRPAPLVESTLDHEHPNWPHGSRDQHANGKTTQQHIKKVFHQLAKLNDFRKLCKR